MDLPKDKLVVITGPSGSGKSSLAFETLYAEGSADTLSLSFARQIQTFNASQTSTALMGSPQLSRSNKQPQILAQPWVPSLFGYLRLLFARAGTRCPECSKAIEGQSAESIVDRIWRTLPGRGC